MALEEFARAYWPPLYRFIRLDGYNRQDAQDLTQAFYLHFLEKHLLRRVTARSGKFRNYLLTCLKHFLSDERDRAAALKRGGDKCFIALDALVGEERDAVEPSTGLTPDQIYERRWARTVLDRARALLQTEYLAKDRLALYDALKDVVGSREASNSYAEIAARLGLSESAIKSSAHRLRARFFEILREEIGRTVSCREEIDDEIRHLISVLGN